MAAAATFVPSLASSIIDDAIARYSSRLHDQWGPKALAEAHARYEETCSSAAHVPLVVVLRRQLRIEAQRAAVAHTYLREL